jgi:hypothetical protein
MQNRLRRRKPLTTGFVRCCQAESFRRRGDSARFCQPSQNAFGPRRIDDTRVLDPPDISMRRDLDLPLAALACERLGENLDLNRRSESLRHTSHDSRTPQSPSRQFLPPADRRIAASRKNLMSLILLRLVLLKPRLLCLQPGLRQSCPHERLGLLNSLLLDLDSRIEPADVEEHLGV